MTDAAAALAGPVPADAADPLAALRAAYARVDAYQPVYGLEAEFADRPVSRGCRDRCDYLEGLLAPDIANLRLLDVGCSMGYLSLHFAARGALVCGLDHVEANVEFCRTLALATGATGVEFRRGVFDLEFCEQLEEGSFDGVFLFSVLHHVVHAAGLARTQQMLRRLLDKVDVIFLELARTCEAVPFAWRESLPTDELAVLGDLAELEVERLREFPALGETTLRPLYRVRRRRKRLNGVQHDPVEVRRSTLKTGQARDRKYYLDGTSFTKCFVFDADGLGVYHRFLAERTAYGRIGPHPHFMPLLGAEVRGRLGVLTFPRVAGRPLIELIPEGGLDHRRVALAAVAMLRAFAAAGLYWNDFRSHNITLAGDRILATDLEVSAPIEIEHTVNVFLWLLRDMQTGSNDSYLQPEFQPGRIRRLPAPPIGVGQYRDDVQDFAAAALSAADLHAFLATTRHLA